MMPRKRPVHVADSTKLTIDLKWLLLIAGALITTAGSAGVIVYQVNELGKATTELHAQADALKDQQRELDMRIKELAVTLRNKGVLQ